MKLACGGRMAESVELCIQISTPTTPRHHRDEELPMPNDRICRTVCTDQQLVNSSNIENLRIYWTVDTNRPRVSESIITMCLEMHFGGHRKWEISINCLPNSHTDINTYKKFITRRHWFVKEFHRFWPCVNIHNMFWRWTPDPPHGRVGKRPQQHRAGFAGPSLCGGQMKIPENSKSSYTVWQRWSCAKSTGPTIIIIKKIIIQQQQ